MVSLGVGVWLTGDALLEDKLVGAMVVSWRSMGSSCVCRSFLGEIGDGGDGGDGEGRPSAKAKCI